MICFHTRLPSTSQACVLLEDKDRNVLPGRPAQRVARGGEAFQKGEADHWLYFK